jgi:glycogen debranching enzyme
MTVVVTKTGRARFELTLRVHGSRGYFLVALEEKCAAEAAEFERLARLYESCAGAGWLAGHNRTLALLRRNRVRLLRSMATTAGRVFTMTLKPGARGGKF